MQCLSTCSVSLSGSQYPGLQHSEKISGKRHLDKINCIFFPPKRFHRLRVLYNSLFLQTVHSGTGLNQCLVSATLPKTRITSFTATWICSPWPTHTTVHMHIYIYIQACAVSSKLAITDTRLIQPGGGFLKRYLHPEWFSVTRLKGNRETSCL